MRIAAGYPGAMTGTVEQIAIAAEESALPGTVDQVEVSAAGVAGDRYAEKGDITLIDLVGKRFRVGEVEVVGRELCEPCAHLQSLTRPGVLRGMVHRAGLNADIVTPGRIAVGDRVDG